MKITIIGLGQIGGSLAWALKKNGFEVLGISRRQKTLNRALKLKMCDSVSDSIPKSLKSDVIILCVHIGLYKDMLLKLRYFDAIVSDVGSVKRIFYNLCTDLGIEKFVGAHPLAGAEKYGIESSDPNLFVNSKCIISGYSDKNSLSKVEKLWRSVGAKTLIMTPSEHDEQLSYSSHLVHIISFSLARTVFPGTKLWGTSLKDMLRVSKRSPQMWADIFVANYDFSVNAVKKFEKNLKYLKDMIKKRDNKRLAEVISSLQKNLPKDM